MEWHEALIPAIVCATFIRLDSLLIGPYWSFYEIVSGMGGTESEFWYKKSTIRWAIVRRFAYLGMLGLGMSVVDAHLETFDAVLLGALTAFLLLWPMLFHGLPPSLSRRDWQLYALYGSVVVGFAASSAFGHFLIEIARKQAQGNLRNYLLEKALTWVISLILGVVGVAFFNGSLESLKEKKRQRDSETG